MSFTEFKKSCLGFFLDGKLQVLLERAHSTVKQSHLGVDMGSFIGSCSRPLLPTNGASAILVNRIPCEDQKENVCRLLFLNPLNC